MVNCQQVVTIPQFRGTCWFNALLMAIFYSQHMREMILKSTWDPTMPTAIKTNIQTMMEKYYIKDAKKSYLKFFEEFKPETFLKLLHIWKPKWFPVNPDNERTGYRAKNYLLPLLTKFGISNCLYLDIIQSRSSDTYKLLFGKWNTFSKGQYNEWNPVKIKAAMSKNPDVLIIMTQLPSEEQDYPSHYRISDDFNLQSEMKFQNSTYVVDSVLIANFNKKQCTTGHAIAGVTCNNKRFIFNGWTKTTVDIAKDARSISVTKEPCKLMPFDWLASPNMGFCLNLSRCELDPTDEYFSKVCFNMFRGSRTYIYVRKPQPTVPNTEPTKTIQPLPTKSKPPILPFTDKPKECPPGKILNPKTNRCVKIDGKIGSMVIKGQK